VPQPNKARDGINFLSESATSIYAALPEILITILSKKEKTRVLFSSGLEAAHEKISSSRRKLTQNSTDSQLPSPEGEVAYAPANRYRTGLKW